jgi:ABC-2 type transport system permease protein
MGAATRYFRLIYALGRYSLATELAFRGNFLVKITVEILWLFILLVFTHTLFSGTTGGAVAGWSESEYLFFVGCYFAMEGLIETFFLVNCGEFTELVRTGNLDIYLLRPIDEQFLISCRNLDWSTAPNVLMGAGVMAWSLHVNPEWHWDPLRAAAFVVVFSCTLAIAYGFLITLTASAVWLVRNQSLLEVWWLVTSLMRYPKEIYRGWAEPIAKFFTYVVPIMLVVNMPAETMVKVFDWRNVGLTMLATVIVLTVSRWFFLRALRSYRSASS